MAKRRRRRSSAATKFLIFLLVAVLAVALIIYLSKSGGTVAVSTASVEINEVMTSNKGAVPDGQGNFPDWIEIHNRTDKAVDISGYGLSDDLLSAAKWTFPSNTSIEAGGYVVVFCSGSTEDGDMHAPFKLSASDDVILTTVSGTVIDSVTLKAVTSGNSLGRDAADTSVWKEMRPSPGYENTDAGADAYLQTLTATADESVGVYINEFMPSNASTVVAPDGSYADWIELYNTTGAAVDLSGYGISDNTSQPLKYTLPAGTTIEAYGVLLIYCTGRQTPDGQAEIEAPFGLAAYQESVVFSTPAGRILDSYDYTRAETDVSWARSPDGTGDFVICAQPTPGYTNNEAGLSAYLAGLSYGTGDVILSEALNANYSYLKQPDDSYPDWIEVHNRTDHAISLAGYALSNNAKNPAKWVFPDITLDAGEYLAVLATGKNVSDAQKKNNLETNFRLSGDGAVVLLFSPEGEILDKLQIGRGHVDTSYGRTGTDLMYYETPTPNAANSAGVAGYATTPALSLVSGCYDGAQTLSIDVPAGCTVTYTTDGSEPSSASAQYTGPLTIAKTAVIRARSFSGSLLGSDIATASYIIYTGENTVQSHRHNNIAVMSLVTDPKNLWDPQTGIYVVGSKVAGVAPDEDENAYVLKEGMNADYATSSNFWQSWEKAVHFDLIDATGASEYSSDGVIRIFGAFSRGKEQKGFSLIARSGYGPTMFDHAFFENRDIDSYQSVILRASAQDATYSRIRDIVVTSLLEDGDLGLSPLSDIYVQAYRQLVVYINGEYWGVYNLREKISKYFIAAHYGVADVNTIDILMGNGNEKCVIAGNGWKDYTDMVKWADEHDLSQQANYDYICSLMDVENYAAYCAAEIAVGNTDTGNIKYWRSTELDNKWRWLYYDFCWAMNRNDDSADEYSSGYRRDFFARYFHPEGHGSGKNTSTKLSRALLKNASFRALFLQKLAIMLNEVYTPEKIVARVDLCQSYIAEEMVYDVDLWNSIGYTSWQQHCDNIRAYANNYQNYCLKYVQAYFSLSDSDMNAIFGRKSSL